MNKNKYEIDMCNGSIMDKLISFALPLMLSGILQLMFNAVDIIVVGHFSSSQALAAVGSTTALINVFVNLFIGVSLGTNVLAARCYAAGKDKEMSEVVHTSILFALISGIVMAVIGVLLAKPALQLMQTPADVIDQSALYMRIYFLGMPFFMLYNYGAAVLRAVGDTKRPLMYLILSGIVNTLLNLFLVIVFRLAVAGVAISTIIAQCISCILILNCLRKSESSYKLTFSGLSIKWVYLRQIFQVGIPAGIQSTVTQACMSFTSQNFGVGKYKRVDLVLRDCMILTVGVSLVLGGGAYLFGNEVLRIYTNDSEVVRCGVEILSITTVPYFLCGIMDLFPGSLRGMGYSTVPMILSVVGTVGMRIFWIYRVFPFHRSLYVLFISYPASWTFTIIMQVICFICVRKIVNRR